MIAGWNRKILNHEISEKKYSVKLAVKHFPEKRSHAIYEDEDI